MTLFVIQVLLRDSWDNPRETQDVELRLTFDGSDIATSGAPGRVLAAPVPTLVPNGHTTATWDFETGDLRGWTLSGAAFANQPTFGDNSAARGGVPADPQGLYYIGTYENRHTATGTPGKTQGDAATGTLTSALFPLTGSSMSLRLGGCGDGSKVYAALLVDGAVVRRAGVSSGGGVCDEKV